jgi:hypothetical protein
MACLSKAAHNCHAVTVGELFVALNRLDDEIVIRRCAHLLAQTLQIHLHSALVCKPNEEETQASSAVVRRCVFMRRFLTSSRGGFVKTDDREKGDGWAAQVPSGASTAARTAQDARRGAPSMCCAM